MMRIRGLRSVTTALTLAASMMLLSGIAPIHARAALRSGQSATTPPHGTWKTFMPRTTSASVHLFANSQPQSVINPGGGSPCPDGTTDYTGDNAIFNCWDIVKDGSGHDVWIREGYNGVNDSGFGYFHFYDKHNLDLQPVEVTIQRSGYGILQSSTGRYLYEEYFVDSNGNTDQWVQVFEQRTKGTNSPDNNELGVVTPYCMDGNFNEEDVCPDWVNQTL